MIVSILGCGWYGKALAEALIADGNDVNGSATSPEKLESLSALGINPFLVDFKADGESYDPVFFNCDVLIVSIPPKARHGEGGDYLPKIKRTINAIVKHRIEKVIYVSSTAVYGDSCTEVTEVDIPKPDTEPGKILLKAEKLFQSEATFRTTVIRFGGLVGPGRHPGRFFAGKKDVPNGRAPVNLVHLNDCVGITLAVISQDAFGHSINGVSPHHPQKSGFYAVASLQTGLTPPEFIDELKDWKIVNSRVLPGVLNYQFRVANWDDCKFD